MFSIRKTVSSSIGKKLVVAITAIFLSFFLIVHMAGNLLMYAGRDAINAYSQNLQSMHLFGVIPGMIWGGRLFFLSVFIVHITFTVLLSRENARARPIPYQNRKSVQSKFASEQMLLTGLLILSFIIFHLLHFTFGKIQPEYAHRTDHLGRADVYGMVLSSFQYRHRLFSLELPSVAISYLIALGFLALHLSHGISSLFQTLGLVRQGRYKTLHRLAIGFACGVCSGFASIPLGILLGFIG